MEHLEMEVSINRKLDQLACLMSPETADQLAAAFRSYVFGVDRPKSKRELRNDGPSFWKAFQQITPLRLTDSELRYLETQERLSPGQTAFRALQQLTAER